MADDEAPDLTGDLYALVVYLHASCNRDLLDAIGREQLSYNQLQLLDQLRGGRRRPTVRQAAAMIHLTPQGASRLADHLAQEGLIQRELDDDDYRAKRLVITEKGERVIARLHAARLDVIANFAEQLPADEAESLHAGLRPLLEHDHIAAFRPQEAAA